MGKFQGTIASRIIPEAGKLPVDPGAGRDRERQD
jgi:hypothetical protein